MDVAIKLLGGFGVSVGGVAVADDAWGRRSAAALAKLLALAPQRRLHREQVIDALWPEVGVAEAGPRLHKAAHFARRSLGGAGFGSRAARRHRRAPSRRSGRRRRGPVRRGGPGCAR